MLKTNTIHIGDCAEVMKSFPDDCIDLTVTSPPYDNLRTCYNFVFDFETIARELFRITKSGGVVVWIVGDASVNGSETGTSFRQALYFKELGFNLHDTMIYEKVGMRYPDSLRYNASFEYMFVFSRGLPKTFNAILDRKNIYKGEKIARKNQIRQPNGKMKENSAYRNDPNRKVRGIGCRNNIWKISSAAENARGQNHPAKFPEALARDHILSWSNKGDIVLDCFAGSGTTLKMAKELGRRWIGIEINPEYVKLAEKRIAAANVPLEGLC